MGDTQCHINAFVNKTDNPVKQQKLRPYCWVQVKIIIKYRAQDTGPAGDRGGYGQQTAWCLCLAFCQKVGFFDINEDATACRGIAFTRLAKTKCTCGTVQ